MVRTMYIGCVIRGLATSLVMGESSPNLSNQPSTGLRKSYIQRLRELTPVASGGQEVGSRNLRIKLLPDPV